MGEKGAEIKEVRGKELEKLIHRAIYEVSDSGKSTEKEGVVQWLKKQGYVIEVLNEWTYKKPRFDPFNPNIKLLSAFYEYNGGITEDPSTVEGLRGIIPSESIEEIYDLFFNIQ